MKNLFELIGRYFLLMGKVFSKPEKASIYGKRILAETESLGLNSIGIVAIISVFMGAVITIQMALNLESPFIPKYLIGYAARESMLLEFSSTVVALILAGKVGSNIASEIGTMRITEQIDALEIMGVNSASYLILPKIVSTVFFFPFLTILSMIIGVAGGYVVSILTGAVNPRLLHYRYPVRLQAVLHHLLADQVVDVRIHHHVHFGLLRLLRRRQLARGRPRQYEGGRREQHRDSDFQPDSHPSPSHIT